METATAADLAAFFSRPLDEVVADPRGDALHESLLLALELGHVRAAEKADDGAWRAVPWVKAGILAGFRRGRLRPFDGCGVPAFDKSTLPPRRFTFDDQVRLVPGGSMVRRGAYVAAGVVIMPPAYVNVGAFVGKGTMIDSHALVGSCAQIGERVHLSAAAQVGGVLEPAQARPVVIEDEAFVGGLSGVFEGVVVRRRAVLAAGVILSASTAIVDLVHGGERRGEVPESAVVVPGTRPARDGVALAAAVIVKYRDARTDAATALEGALR